MSTSDLILAIERKNAGLCLKCGSTLFPYLDDHGFNWLDCHNPACSRYNDPDKEELDRFNRKPRFLQAILRWLDMGPDSYSGPM